MRLTKTVGQYYFGKGALAQLEALVDSAPEKGPRRAVFFVDHFFDGHPLMNRLPVTNHDQVLFVDTTHEPSTAQVDALASLVREAGDHVSAVIGVGGGSTLDTAKAVSNLLGNGGQAADYQGWDLLANPGVFKIGVPTLSGTGAEASRTCVMMNYEKNLKLGMNSDHTVYDRLVLDPELTATVPRDQYFFTGMDTYIHCIESLAGRYRHAVADSFSHAALADCRQVFGSDDMQSDDNRERLMTASFLGGSAIGNSYVGVVHPFSAGLSMVLGLHHCVANCIVMNVMQEFYPRETEEFHGFLERQRVTLPTGVCAGLSDADFDRLYDATVVHQIPLKNALGDDFKCRLTKDKVADVFRRM